MKKIIILTALALVAATTVLFLVYASKSGAFKKIEPVAMEEKGPYTLVYKEHKGDYSKVLRVINEIYSKLVKDYNIIAHRRFGIYYDNPGEVKKENLRSEAGVILEGRAEEKDGMLSGEFKVKTIEQKNCPVTEFPYLNQGSVVFGLIKAYPALNKYVKENGPYDYTYSMEIYDIPGGKITYMLR